MEIAEARKLKQGAIVETSQRAYRLSIHKANKHDLWFWACAKRTHRVMNSSAGGWVERVYLGNPPQNLDFLTLLQ